MRAILASLALLSLLSLPARTHAEAIDVITITSAEIGFNATFTLPNTQTELVSPGALYFGQTEGILNGVPTTFYPQVSTDSIFGCAILIGYAILNCPGGNWLQVVYPPGFPEVVTLTFTPGTYDTEGYLPDQFDVIGHPFQLTITPESATVTPEPSSLLLVGTALVASAMLLAGKRRPGLHRRS